MLKLPDALLALAASVSGDGGQRVADTLAALVAEVTPFDAGEIVVERGGGVARRLFGREAGSEPLLGADLLAHLAAVRNAVRVDILEEAAHFPETRQALARRGLRSALALPFATADIRGAVVITRSQGWGLAGASLTALGPLAVMAGIAMDQALTLTGMAAELEHLRGGRS